MVAIWFSERLVENHRKPKQLKEKVINVSKDKWLGIK